MAVTEGARHAERVQAVVRDALAPAQSAIAASWRRSALLHGLDPDRPTPPPVVSDAELRAAKGEIGPLLDVSKAVLDRLFLTVAGAGCCVILTNRDGVTLERRGEAGDDHDFRQAGLWIGAVWSEAAQGTNGVGTCLAEQRLVTVHQDQHFRTAHTALSCTTAPVFDEFGRLAAALDVSACRGDLNTAMLGLVANAVAEAARSIETANFRRAFSPCRILVAPDELAGPSALLAVDGDDLVVGATRSARQALGVTDRRIADKLPTSDLFPHGARGNDDWLSAERGVILRALARAGNKVSAAARELGVSRATLHRKLKRLGVAAHD